MINFSRAGKKSREHFFEELQCIVELLQNTNGEEVVFNVVHCFHYRFLCHFFVSRTLVAGRRVAAEKLDVFPSDGVHALLVFLLNALVDCLKEK